MSRKLGQHFLKDKTKIKLIARSLEIKSSDLILEIGPGHGELTSELLENGAVVYAIEKDNELVSYLNNNFDEYINKNKLKMINGDAVKEINKVVKSFGNKKYKIVGNIPYYITGYLLRIVGELENKPVTTAFLLQREVGERVCATKGKMNLIGASVQFWAEPRIVGRVKSGSFSPPPKVESVILKLKTKTRNPKITPEKYYKFINIIFKQPRKTIKNNIASSVLKDVSVDDILNKFGYNNDIRAHQLGVDEIIHLATSFT